MESIQESKESVRSPADTGKGLQLDLHRLTTGPSGEPGSPSGTAEDVLSGEA